MVEYWLNEESGEPIEVLSPWVNGRAKKWSVVDGDGKDYPKESLYRGTLETCKRITKEEYKKLSVAKVLKHA